MDAEAAFLAGLGMGLLVGLVLGLILSMWWLHWAFFGGGPP